LEWLPFVCILVHFARVASLVRVDQYLASSLLEEVHLCLSEVKLLILAVLFFSFSGIELLVLLLLHFVLILASFFRLSSIFLLLDSLTSI